MPTKKTNPHPPKFPGAARPRPDHHAFRKEEAKERQKFWDGLNAKQKLAELDRRLGAGEGAVKQRARLQAEIAAPKKAVVPTKENDNVQKAGQERTTAKDRRAAEQAKRPGNRNETLPKHPKVERSKP